LIYEFDILNIIKELRVARFLVNLQLAPYQQQVVNYFKQYSMDTKNLRPQSYEFLTKA